MLPVSQEEHPMSLLYAGLDVSLDLTSICVVDADGCIVCEKKVLSEPEAITACLLGLPDRLERMVAVVFR